MAVRQACCFALFLGHALLSSVVALYLPFACRIILLDHYYVLTITRIFLLAIMVIATCWPFPAGNFFPTSLSSWHSMMFYPLEFLYLFIGYTSIFRVYGRVGCYSVIPQYPF